MNPGFYIIMAAQFFSALADNALLIAAIAVLRDLQAPESHEPLLKTVFTLSYVVLAAFVGAYADSMPKGRVMFISNAIKVFGCALMFFDVHPLIAYAVVGLGAAAYSPAKYGILTELLPPRLLVVANGWIEGLTVLAIILGTTCGGLLVKPEIAGHLLALNLPAIDSIAEMALLVIGLLYLLAAIFNLYVPNTGVAHRLLKRNPLYLLHDFNHSLQLLWRDKLGQISLAVTTLFWGVGATTQFLVINWAADALGLDLTTATLLQGTVALGVAIGAVMAARLVSLRNSVRVIPLGMAMGVVLLAMVFVKNVAVAVALLVLLGVISGFFVVPMNALLQHRGHVLMGAGHSIAVQNFNENLSILLMTGLYALLMMLQLSIYLIITLFALSILFSMALIWRHHRHNQRQFDAVALLDDSTDHGAG